MLLEFVGTYDKQKALKAVDPPDFFTGNAEGDVEEKLWFPLMSKEVRKL